VVDQTTEWRRDPYGAHEFRFFSADGKPTPLVMDGGKTSCDRPPTTQPPPAPEPPPCPEPAPAPVIHAAFAPPATVGGADHVSRQSTAQTTDADTDDSAVAGERPRVAVRGVADFADCPSTPAVERRGPETPSHPLKIAYGIVFVLLALSALGLIYVHLHDTGGRELTRSEGATTPSSARPTTTTTLALPTVLQTAPEAAATALVSSWSTGNKAAAITVATSAAVTTLFAAPYTSGLVVDRGCSTTFMPIVCTFGPPGGASPTDPIYEIMVSQVEGGWYVSSVKIEN
jgi:hypothetical protein